MQSHTKSNVTSALIMSCISVNVYNGNPTQLQFIPDAFIGDVILFLVYAVAKLGHGVKGACSLLFFYIHLTPTQCIGFRSDELVINYPFLKSDNIHVTIKDYVSSEYLRK